MITETRRVRQKIDPERWERLKSILDEALEQPHDETRTALLKDRCADDAALLQEAESLLAEAEMVQEQPTDWLEDCAQQATRAFWDEELSRIGQRLGAYAIVRELGRGGMGTVYLAARADGQFKKDVAIKVLKRGTDTEEILHRFSVERQIVANLDHPNIARLVDAGMTADGLPYFVMEFVAGVPVTHFVRDQKLSTRAKLELFLKICAAVEFAHHASVIHRDLKPGNILVNAAGEPKLLDFGIAKLCQLEDGGTVDVTAPGRQHLTPSCASPEQARGESVTAASDVYELGALLFEMLTGRSPHRFTSSQPSREEVVRVICEQEPERPSLAVADPEMRLHLRGDLDQIVLHALRKEPARRYASAAEFADDVRRHLSGLGVQAPRVTRFGRAERPTAGKRPLVRYSFAAAAVVLTLAVAAALWLGTANIRRTSTAPSSAEAAAVLPEKSIAVLPFENLSGAAENAFFAAGVQDAILTDLAKVADLKVLSRGSVEQYSSAKTRDLREISRALNVAHVIEGGVQRAGNRVRVTARLVDGRTGEQKWAENYDRELADVFTIQSQIAQTIVARLQAKLLPREKAAIEVPPTRDPVAYDLYVRAREMVDGYTNAPDPKASLEQAIGLLTDATQRDPQFVVAWCYAARARMVITALGLAEDGVHAREAEAALARAVALNPDLPEVHFAKAELFYRDGGRYEQAEREIALALPGMPNSAPLHTLAGNVWRRQGRWHEAEQILMKAVELDPKNANAISFLADTQILMRRYTEAIATYERARPLGYDPVLFAVRVGIIEFMATGRSEPLRLALLRGPADLDIQGGDTPWRIMFALMDRDYDRATAVLARSPRSTFQDVDLSFYYPRSWYEGVIARAAGRSDEARAAFRQVLADLNADDGRRRFTRTEAIIAQARVAVGETERAIQLAEGAARRFGPGSNAYDAPLTEQGLAQVYTWSGRHDRALEIIERLVKTPGYLSYGHLLHDPAWEPLRGYPRFQALTAALAPGAKAQTSSLAREEVTVEKSIAVLPFENLSAEPENAFFATGVQDAILTDLAKVADLKVLSRASVEQYSNQATRDMREISRALNVAHVIEGGVQRAGNRVRVTARLVDARSGEQKWAQSYDRELADVFSIQSQIAQTIVAQLQAKLLPREKAAIEVPPTRDPVAYDLFLRAREMVDSYLNASDAKASLEQAIGLLEEATQRDPQFAVAWSYAARAHSIICGLGLDRGATHERLAGAALERAFALAPGLPEAHFAKAENFYRIGGRLEQAEREIALALPGMPNSAPLHTLAGKVWRRQARWHEAEQVLIKAVELDPKNANAITFLADTQILVRRYTDAIGTYERARAAGFDPVLCAVRVGVIDFSATGRSERLRAALARGPADLDVSGGETPWRIMFALMDRDYERAAAALASSPRSTFQDVDQSFHYPRSWYEGVIARAAGRSDEARAAFRRALADLGADEKNLRISFRGLTVIAQARAAVGEKELAIESAERAAETVGVGSNAYDQPLIQQGLAQVYTWTGEHERALEIVERLVKKPGYLSYGHLLHDPAWEPLRGSPRFQAIVASIAPR